MKRLLWLLMNVVLVGAVLIVFSHKLVAHCDGMDGPAVKAAQRALQTGNVNLVLIWVQPPNEVEIKEVFNQALASRNSDPNFYEQSDLQFFDTLVRIHRAGEGKSYTGLKPAGRDLGPGIPAADNAIEVGSVGALLRLLPTSPHAAVQGMFKDVIGEKKYNPSDVQAGREFVRAYVKFLHEAEHICETAGRK